MWAIRKGGGECSLIFARQTPQLVLFELVAEGGFEHGCREPRSAETADTKVGAHMYGNNKVVWVTDNLGKKYVAHI